MHETGLITPTIPIYPLPKRGEVLLSRNYIGFTCVSTTVLLVTVKGELTSRLNGNGHFVNKLRFQALTPKCKLVWFMMSLSSWGKDVYRC